MKKVTFGILAALMMASCDSNEDRPSVIEMPEEGIAARLTLSLPTAGSRSETVDPDDNTNSNAGYEIGQDSENHINSVLIVLADQVQNGTGVDYKFIAFAQADATEDNSDGANLPKFTVRIKSPEILAKAEQEIFVFAYCNPTADIMSKVETLQVGASFTDFNASLDANAPIWMANNFLMTNRDLCSKELPTEDEMKRSDIKKPIDLGTVKVQRAAARFDFESTTVKDGAKPNFYPVRSVYNEETIEGYVELVGMSLINMSKTFNYLPMMSANANWSNPVVCERENTNNWVVSTDYDFKSTYTRGDASSYFDFAMSAPGFAPGNANYTMLSSLTDNDNDENWQPGSEGSTNYKIWRYATENTIPGINNQLHGITTGVIFQGYLRGEAGSDLETMLRSGKVLYAYEGHIYGDKDQLKAKAEEAPTTTLAALYNELFTADNMDTNGDLKSTVEDGFTIYRPKTVGSENVYPCYYYYYNRHDNNGDAIVMGQMEFAVVRNNVYKLKVNSINEFGHPGDPGDDPDPEKPEDPDESPKTYFQLSVQALPWVVRVNTIDF